MADSLEADPLIGRLVAQKFRIDRLLGAGAMGRVYLAEQTNLGKQIALKVLHNAMTGDAALAKRFYREAKSASMLSHPNILQIIDFGDDAGLLFIAMELLSGRDLYRAIKQDFPFPLERVGHIGGQILGALDEAHVTGVVHRDLKPENVMLLDVRGESDFVKVCDFGIAKIASERDGEGSAITMAGMVCGTPEYMSPEQARGEPLDGRSDLYAMAVILYQMVTGDVPFRAESALGVITKHLTEEPTPPSKRRNGSVPAPLESVILRGLRKDKNERFASAADMRAALLESVGMRRPSSPSSPRVTASQPADALAVTGVATPVSGTAQAATPAGSGSASSHPSVHGELAAQKAPAARRAGFVVAALALVGAVGGAAWVIVGKKGDVPALTETTPPRPTVAAPLPTPPEPKPIPSEAMPKPAEPQPQPPQPTEATARPAAIPPAPEPPPVTTLATGARLPHKKHEPHKTALAAVAPSTEPAVPVAAPAAAAAAPPKPSTAPKSPFADGEALFKSGDVEGALAKYQEAARANPNDAKTQRQIGKCYNRLGQRDRALPYFKKYLELAPDASDASFIRAMLDAK